MRIIIYFVIGILYYLPSSTCILFSSSPFQSITITKSNNICRLNESSSAIFVRGGAKKASVVEEPKSNTILENLQISSYFALWYLFNIGYNVFNKQALNAVAKPWTIATIQMMTGVFYFVPLWLLGLRKVPKLSFDEIKSLMSIALCHAGVHIGAVIALGTSAVSFAHIVKASEPLVTSLLNFLFFGEILPTRVYLTLIPVSVGVAIASLKEFSFNYIALVSAMLSIISSSTRGVLSKKIMSGKQIGENLDAQNLYAVLAIMSSIILIPLMFIFEGTSFLSEVKVLSGGGGLTKKSLSILIALSGACYYAYNENAFLALEKVNPVTHAVANTVKREVIIVASVIAFKAPMSQGSVIGSTIAMAGTLLYWNNMSPWNQQDQHSFDMLSSKVTELRSELRSKVLEMELSSKKKDLNYLMKDISKKKKSMKKNEDAIKNTEKKLALLEKKKNNSSMRSSTKRKLIKSRN